MSLIPQLSRALSNPGKGKQPMKRKVTRAEGSLAEASAQRTRGAVQVFLLFCLVMLLAGAFVSLGSFWLVERISFYKPGWPGFAVTM